MRARYDRGLHTRSVTVPKKADRTENDLRYSCRTEPP